MSDIISESTYCYPFEVDSLVWRKFCFLREVSGAQSLLCRLVFFKVLISGYCAVVAPFIFDALRDSPPAEEFSGLRVPEELFDVVLS